MSSTDQRLEAFGRLLTIMDELREQCPWDRKQTNESLRNLTIEETYELADAILAGDQDGIKEEIGDLLLHMVFYAKIAEEKKGLGYCRRPACRLRQARSPPSAYLRGCGGTG